MLWSESIREHGLMGLSSMWDTRSWTRMLSVSCKRWALVRCFALNLLFFLWWELFPFQLVYLEVSGIECFSSCVLSFETNIHFMGLLTSISTFFCNVFLLSWRSKANFGPLKMCIVLCVCVCVCVDRWGIEAFNTKGLMGTHHMRMVCPRGEIQGCCQDGACWWTHWHQPFNLPSGLSDTYYAQNFFILCACDSIPLMWLMMFRTELRVPCVCICNGFSFVIRHVQYADRDMDPAFTVLTKIAGRHFIPCADSELATTWRYKT